jgi:hypothetical protein
VAGGNAPYRKDLEGYLANRPEYCIYDGQEPLVPRMMKAGMNTLIDRLMFVDTSMYIYIHTCLFIG